MTKVLITGATGNVGLEVIKSLEKIDHQLDLYAGVRDIHADKIKLANHKVHFTSFDFMDSRTYITALKDCDVVFFTPATSDFGS